MDNKNALAVQQAQQSEGMMQVASSRAAQEIQAAMVIAQKCPRDVVSAQKRIMNACTRKKLAESALYAYPRGGQTVTGPSIRLAEVLAQSWGNIDFGIIELEQKVGESSMMTYAWDLETNTRQTKVFTVKHERKAHGGITKLTDPRDIYELTANQGARRLRACILGVIPGDIIEDAVEQCEKTMKSGEKEPLIERIKKMGSAFMEMGVNAAMLEKRLGHKLEVCSETEMVTMRKIYLSLKDGMSTKDQWFGEGVTEKGSISMDQLKPGTPDAKPEAPAAEAPKLAATPPAQVELSADHHEQRAKEAVAVKAEQPAAKKKAAPKKKVAAKRRSSR